MKWRINRRNGIWLGLLVLMLILFYFGFRTPPQQVDVTEVRSGYFAQTLSDEGKTRVKDRYLVTAPVSGYLERVTLDAGDAIKAGDILLKVRASPVALLDSRTKAQAQAGLAAAEAALKTAQAAVDAEKARRDLAQAELRRLQTMAKEGYVAAERLDQAITQERSAQAALRSAEFQVQVARHQRDNAQYLSDSYTDGSAGDLADSEAVEVRAPVAGIVLKRHRESAGVIGAGEPVLEIADTQSLEVEVDVLSADAVRIKPGMPVRIEHWGGSESLTGSVVRIEPAGFTKYSALGVEEQRVWVIVDFIVGENSGGERLGDGYRVEATFILWQADAVLQVASSALIYTGEQTFVYRVVNGRAEKTPVKAGRRSGLWVQIQEGLQPGDRLIRHPDETIADGVQVKVR